ncbi:hypothetical protein SLEP1_g56664 [Rubroshorea leprosula]|uniref:ATP synthase F0 subunit 8 n=1 Tax=Rubroshorea leprosula TaxID=152421 RepID=A0AAV5MIZ8_9ROSI|nr:hypothetical protein SLEP1_g56664 [Rubroshorea leprosula]
MLTCYLWNWFILVILVVLLVGLYTSKSCAHQWEVYKRWP